MNVRLSGTTRSLNEMNSSHLDGGYEEPDALRESLDVTCGTHTRIHTRIHTHACTRMHTHTRTHTHTTTKQHDV